MTEETVQPDAQPEVVAPASPLDLSQAEKIEVQQLQNQSINAKVQLAHLTMAASNASKVFKDAETRREAASDEVTRMTGLYETKLVTLAALRGIDISKDPNWLLDFDKMRFAKRQ